MSDEEWLEDLGLEEHAKSAAVKLKTEHPEVVFTSGLRSVAQQANAMAGNIVDNRRWIAETYDATTERDTLQKWVDDHPQAVTRAQIAAGLEGVMNGWTKAQQIRISRHIVGLAFDVQPTADAKLKDAIRMLPNIKKFLDHEGGKTIWHAEFLPKT